MRTILCILDSLGCGALPDAVFYGDEGSNTLRHVLKAANWPELPQLQRLGLGNILELKSVLPASLPLAAFGRMMLASPGKDTITGHWELAGLRLEQPFPLYPQGFPQEIITALEERIGRKTLANITASGTETIAEFGEEHLRSGSPIIYTSADSVFQIAAHEEIVPLDELYAICRTARSLLQGGHRVARVIARPFVGEPGAFMRTAHRHDFAVKPNSPNLLTILEQNGIPVRGIGKIADIFCQVGIDSSRPTKSNRDGMLAVEELLQQDEEQGFYFVNLVDFDSLYGHRNDALGYAGALQEFDALLPRWLDLLKPGDRLIITADHGCDPTHPGTDHTREYVPLLVYQSDLNGQDLGVRTSLADIAATECYLRNLPLPLHGEPMIFCYSSAHSLNCNRHAKAGCKSDSF